MRMRAIDYTTAHAGAIGRTGDPVETCPVCGALGAVRAAHHDHFGQGWPTHVTHREHVVSDPIMGHVWMEDAGCNAQDAPAPTGAAARAAKRRRKVRSRD